jgi:hypothetical protein
LHQAPEILNRIALPHQGKNALAVKLIILLQISEEACAQHLGMGGFANHQRYDAVVFPRYSRKLSPRARSGSSINPTTLAKSSMEPANDGYF